MHNILGIIPARSGSKRIPGKNLRMLNGKPLLHYALDAASQSNLLSKIVVSSDSEEILASATSHLPSIEAIKRSPEISKDDSLAIEYVKHCMGMVLNQNKISYDIFVIIQPTSPFTLGLDIDATIQKLLDTHAKSAVSVVEVKHDIHPSKFKIIRNSMLHPLYSLENNKTAAHELDKVYVRNGSVYVTRKEQIEQGLLLADPCVAYIMPHLRSIDINDEIDFSFAEFLIKSSQKL